MGLGNAERMHVHEQAAEESSPQNSGIFEAVKLHGDRAIAKFYEGPRDVGTGKTSEDLLLEWWSWKSLSLTVAGVRWANQRSRSGC